MPKITNDFLDEPKFCVESDNEEEPAFAIGSDGEDEVDSYIVRRNYVVLKKIFKCLDEKTIDFNVSLLENYDSYVGNAVCEKVYRQKQVATQQFTDQQLVNGLLFFMTRRLPNYRFTKNVANALHQKQVVGKEKTLSLIADQITRFKKQDQLAFAKFVKFLRKFEPDSKNIDALKTSFCDCFVMSNESLLEVAQFFIETPDFDKLFSNILDFE